MRLHKWFIPARRQDPRVGANYRLRFSATTWDRKTPMVYISTLEGQEQAQHLTRIVGTKSTIYIGTEF